MPDSTLSKLEVFIVHDVDARFDGKPARSMEVLGLWELKTGKSRWEPWIKLELVRS